MTILSRLHMHSQTWSPDWQRNVFTTKPNRIKPKQYCYRQSAALALSLLPMRPRLLRESRFCTYETATFLPLFDYIFFSSFRRLFCCFYFISHCTLRIPWKTKEEEFKFPSNYAKPLNEFLSSDWDNSMELNLGKWCERQHSKWILMAWLKILN